MIKFKKKKRIRLTGKRRARLPVSKADDNGFALRAIEQADGRFSLVKRLRQRLQKLIEDAGINTVQKEMLAGRAVFLCSYLESLEVSCAEGKRLSSKKVDIRRYTQAVNSLKGILISLGIDKSVSGELGTLEDYMAKKKLRKRRKVRV